jgi:hypothetical protein
MFLTSNEFVYALRAITFPSSNGCRAAHDLGQFLGDRGLAGLVVDELELADELGARGLRNISVRVFLLQILQIVALPRLVRGPETICDDGPLSPGVKNTHYNILCSTSE